MKSSRLKPLILHALGTVISVVPTVVAVLSYFPLWAAEGGESVLSGFTALLLILSALPIYRALKHLLRSPSAWVMWLVCFLVFLLLSRIADEMTVISFVGLISNLIGALLFRLAGGKSDEKSA